ncbi:ULT1 INTERACTING FACTOR 1, HRS1 HOMOLOG5 [Hibiscus trionum]|uniref:ULT1 INTERACTING FACTOR 1, HRS1 HOMOLOG5 n=1 Tax=Hibiscus trionum TaxID=183268 RepID=A0A9W7LL64_HIBTR|nr:ULT1 INTERACTING FACTOR 1, HRS1 HOMOLOG5 [Hibiscus trionum]
MELSLDLSLPCVPGSITEFLKEVSKIENGFQRLLKISDFVKRLEDEMKKIDALKRELPFCMLLLKDVIERLKEEEMQCKKMDDGLVTEELMLPLKRNSEENGRVDKEKDGGDKKNWMTSVQLWNSDSDDVDHRKKSNKVPELKLRNQEEEEEEEDLREKPTELCNDKIFKGQVDKENLGLSLMFPSSELGSCKSILKSNGSCGIGFSHSLHSDRNRIKFQTKHQQQHEQLQQMQNSRKQRRCWSPELHRRFVEALQQLGGSKVATPKQIREVMQVEDLTNDEVKSHLQKYRLHFRKLPASSA